ncbi:DEAD/DEAH box helicase [Arthrobacter burdickii]|uniref:DEAD/DEAH box helicase n=1 Tax=Arthrobacter burdickii TaxID=3035920 RepID=A0ABT8K672_9MICC|nr:DEAD/DEAH box helicase [Arthrobacter burdickii]MDN4612316.1 DEAD/DEAH box helicase [Arthrobacter burdickii]
MSGFDQLSPAVQHHIANSLGWASLRPLQDEAVEPLLRGDDALLLAPTAGGKTEAAMFPLLSRMSSEEWRGTSVLYVCPLRALLNNLEPRIAGYASWLGRTASVRHGDTGAGVRRRQLLDAPDILLTTPESLESMLVSTTTDAERFFASLRAVVVDEIHAFAGDDRGWHLLSVLERITKLGGQPLQRIGLSATVGNAPELLHWLQGGSRGRPAVVVAPDGGSGPTPIMDLDYVGSTANAAKIVAALHRGQKRLVFADSRRVVEELALALRDRDVETHVSHSSLSLDTRRRSEAAFAVGRDCVIVSTSTLELGIDVGDLDRVIQLGSPRTVASLLQRLGRTGRRADTTRNMLFLATDEPEFLRATGLLLLWSEGYVEPVVPPLSPRHVAAQQMLGLTLQERRVGDNLWQRWFGGLELATPEEWTSIRDWLLDQGHLDTDSGMLFAGPEAEKRYGRIHYRDLMAVFTADPQVLILHGRQEVGAVDPMLLQRKVEGPRLITLGGRPWEVTYVDWKRRRAYVEPSTQGGVVKWASMPQPYSFALCDAIRRALLGADPQSVHTTTRAQNMLSELRDDYSNRVDEARTVVGSGGGSRVRWWTWAGARGNAVLVAALSAVQPELFDTTTAYDNWQIALRGDATASAVASAVSAAKSAFGPDFRGVVPTVDERAVRQLKFFEMLPPELAMRTVAERMTDYDAAANVASRGFLDLS